MSTCTASEKSTIIINEILPSVNLEHPRLRDKKEKNIKRYYM